MSEKEVKTFGKRVRALRKRLRLTQKAFGLELGISLQHLSDIELDKKKPCHDFFFNMVKVFKVNLNYLLLGEGEMFLGKEEKEGAIPKRFKTGNPDVDVFLHYFFNSDIVKFHSLFEFSNLMAEKGDRIKKNTPKPEV